MNLYDVILSGNMTLSELTTLIDNNIVMAESLGLKLTAKRINGMTVGFIYDGEKKIFERSYNRKYQHLNTAAMQGDFATLLTKVKADRQPKPVANEKLHAYSEMTMAERAWYNQNKGTQEQRDFEAKKMEEYEKAMRKKAQEEDYGA
ncbi:hypothetical protein R1T16_17565 [Flavobacterium sp. DG1-102-2]|uniref:hypothetical protein n=1 Tax=Flavobacterium sp. DG1-102-2 TaxID=3081663 RepID=UPI002949D1AC|nr:hypothetical protein [Flavobacterium sp. DG1-102-2]MDV6170249.1 hypothetical protein [Flavobacterium sp. DG1-102-2]